MIPRYRRARIDEIWSLETKYQEWQNVEIAVPQAREKLGRIPPGTSERMRVALTSNPIDSAKIDEFEKINNHDLNAFLEERIRFLVGDLDRFFHQAMTSYDTEESAFVKALLLSCMIVIEDTKKLLESLRRNSIKYRYMPMNARTHGQEAEMQSLGKRMLTWYQDLALALETLMRLIDRLKYSKLSGAIGTNSGIDPELERVALEILGLKPWHGATQILPRVLYSSIASAIADIAMVTNKIATDIRLGARSGRPIYNEPFSKKQKGSSAMPHKKNTINCEKIAGMANMAMQYDAGIKNTIVTWEERAIEQSSVERVFWPDLFHVTLHALQTLTRVIDGLVVYPDNMIIEIIESRGTYASSAAKELLVELCAEVGIKREDVYRLVQLACFNLFEPGAYAKQVRAHLPNSLEDANKGLEIMSQSTVSLSGLPSLQSHILKGFLRVHPDLDPNENTVKEWNEKLNQVFYRPGNEANKDRWNELFRPSVILASEAHLFRQVFGV